MSRLLATLSGLRGFGGIAPYVVLAVVMPGGFAVAPLLYWRRRKLGLA
jgi:hypothetical protein